MPDEVNNSRDKDGYTNQSVIHGLGAGGGEDGGFESFAGAF